MRNGATIRETVAHAAKVACKRAGLAAAARRLVSRPWDKAIRLGRRVGWANAAHLLLSPEKRWYLQEPSRVRALECDIVTDVELELLFTAIRAQLLLSGEEIANGNPLCGFIAGLIRQCDANEQVFFVSEAEKVALRNDLVILGGENEPSKLLDLLIRQAMYRSPREILQDPIFGDALHQTLPPDLRQVFADAARDIDAERRVSVQVNDHGNLQDAMSQRVATQYEENPYPRWTTLRVEPGFRRNELRRYFTTAECDRFMRPFEVLVAGCATGRQAIRCAIGYESNASVTAIDLSKASLAYAARKAADMDVDNVAFHRLDIMDVGRLGKVFDIVECTGVLHHMADPIGGWKALVDVLHPGGAIYVGLYSRLARDTVSRCRREIAELGLKSTPDDIRRYRRELIEREVQEQIWLQERYFPFCRDFFTTSNCRDLLFHVNEHQFTIPQIRDAIAELGLQFRGFRRPPTPRNRIWFRSPHPDDLDGWWHLEKSNPEVFAEMYEFWCYKPRTVA